MQLKKEFIKTIEIEYLKVVASLLRKNDLDSKTAKESAQAFLQLLPFSSYEDMETKIKAFIQTYPQFKHLEVLILKTKEENNTQELLEKMRGLMKNNQIDAAIQIAKQ